MCIKMGEQRKLASRFTLNIMRPLSANWISFLICFLRLLIGLSSPDWCRNIPLWMIGYQLPNGVFLIWPDNGWP